MIEIRKPRDFQVGDLVYIFEAMGGYSEGDVVRVTGVNRKYGPHGGPSGYKIPRSALRILSQHETNACPKGTELVTICPGRFGHGEVWKKNHTAPLLDTYALKSLPTATDPKVEQLTKLIDELGKQLTSAQNELVKIKDKQ